MEDIMPDFGYRIAEEMDIDFYAHFDISPIGILSDCGYDNLKRLGIEEGYDVCEHMDEKDFKCEDCELSTQVYPWYPPITDDIIVNLLLICGTDGLDLSLYYSKDHKQQIFNWVIIKATNDSVKKSIRDLLIGHIQEWSRL